MRLRYSTTCYFIPLWSAPGSGRFLWGFHKSTDCVNILCDLLFLVFYPCSWCWQTIQSSNLMIHRYNLMVRETKFSNLLWFYAGGILKLMQMCVSENLVIEWNIGPLSMSPIYLQVGDMIRVFSNLNNAPSHLEKIVLLETQLLNLILLPTMPCYRIQLLRSYTGKDIRLFSSLWSLFNSF